jgi:hypothetical protein
MRIFWSTRRGALLMKSKKCSVYVNFGRLMMGKNDPKNGSLSRNSRLFRWSSPPTYLEDNIFLGVNHGHVFSVKTNIVYNIIMGITNGMTFNYY